MRRLSDNPGQVQSVRRQQKAHGENMTESKTMYKIYTKVRSNRGAENRKE